MNSITTRYGKLSGIEFKTLFSNGKTDGCLVSRHNVLETPYGNLVPQYEAEDMGRRTTKPVYFYKDGSLKSIALQTQTPIATPVGLLPAELVTFHKSGTIRRVFPLDGRLSGFWSWQNEFALAETTTIDSPVGSISAKFINIQFYESGALKSITLWPGQVITVLTPVGSISVRKGIAFYESGEIRSFEPLKKTELSTPIGKMLAYDNEPNGIHGDINSVQLAPDGSVEALCTVDHAVQVSLPDQRCELFRPGVKNNVCGDEKKVSVPLKIRFDQGKVTFDDNLRLSFEINRYRFEVRKHDKKMDEPAYSCG
ncbi:MAG: hypothetical protein K9I59_03205 [Chlorobium sp.]|jgi:hypothetical protein|uniref:hypothetical protein n=1 Tax=Chlorobium sp. TaxID=1095 RepID=UPI001D2A858F|nr:hypothetical protein [Chlorobium sp.]MBN1278445.1 hypothetical protein [Chlorobiaceae bacterium]MCF8215853.1 hypothetical protein [Chlorobium sp.]MCF8270751.1 hypothetical protein [Chlorobium sp.]MCF8287063.1 hypothetical protein [Chlorobium sp.]MCF8290720.1 hypothetical protein [Chlorobium sp.]